MRLWHLLHDKQFLHGVTTLIGTMVGVGIFGIPFVFAKAGYSIGLFFLILTAALTILFDLMFAEVVLRTKARHQLAGYTYVYLGPFFKRVVLLTNTLGIYGALLAYLIISGEFLHNVLSNIFFLSSTQYSLLFFVVGSLLVYLGIKTVRWVEFFLTAFFIGIMVIVFFVGAPHVQIENLMTMTLEFWFLPYGVLLFAFAGLTSVPIQREIMYGHEKELRTAIITAVSVVAVLYFLFATIVVGVSGDLTTPDTLSGLFDFLGERIIVLCSLFGVLTITTSFLLLGTALLEMFHLDYGIKRRWAWLLVIAPPVVFFLAGMRTFIDVIGLVGTVAIGLESAVFVAMYLRARHRGDRKPEFHLKVPSWVLFLTGALFMAGVLYELFIA